MTFFKMPTRSLLPLFFQTSAALLLSALSLSAQADETAKKVQLAETAPAVASDPLIQPITSCTNSMSYNFYYKDSLVGQIQREQVWHNQQSEMSTSGNVSFLMFNFKGNNTSKVYWNEARKQFLTREFNQNVKGFTRTKMSATFSDNGLVSNTIVNGEPERYSDLDLPILDFEAMSVQMRQNVIDNKREFDFIMQRTAEITRYYFSIVGQERVTVLGKEYTAIKVQQVKKKDRQLYFWFVPELDYQLVQSTYKRKIIDISATVNAMELGCAKG